MVQKVLFVKCIFKYLRSKHTTFFFLPSLTHIKNYCCSVLLEFHIQDFEFYLLRFWKWKDLED